MRTVTFKKKVIVHHTQKKEAHHYLYLSLFRAPSSLITDHSWFIFPATIGHDDFCDNRGKSPAAAPTTAPAECSLSQSLAGWLSSQLEFVFVWQEATFWLRPYQTLVSSRESPDHVCRYLRPNGWCLWVIKTRKTKKKLGHNKHSSTTAPVSSDTTLYISRGVNRSSSIIVVVVWCHSYTVGLKG